MIKFTMSDFIEGVWHPLINKEKCRNCGICYDFCPKGVFANKGGEIVVETPYQCVDKCHGCEWRCSYGAISFPKPFSKVYAKKVIRYYCDKGEEVPGDLIKYIKINSIMTEEEVNQYMV